MKNRTFAQRALIAAAVTAAIGGAAALGGMAPAMAATTAPTASAASTSQTAEPTISFDGGTIHEDGVYIGVPVTISCRAGQSYTLELGVSQTKPALAAGTTTTTGTCTGGSQPIGLAVRANTSFANFSAGAAQGAGQITVTGSAPVTIDQPMELS